MKKEHSCNALKALKIIRIILSIMLLAYTLSLCIIGHCASDQDYFPMEQNKNGKFTETDITNIETTFDSSNNYIIARYHHTNSSGTKYVRVLYFPKDNSVMIYGEIFNNLHQFSVYKVGTGNVKSQDITLSNNTLTKQGSAGTNYFNDFTSVESSNYSSDIDYVSNFQLYSNNNPDTRKIVLLYGSQEPVISDDDVASEEMEKPNISDYIPEWSNKPTFDSSSVENALQSVYNGITWLGDNIVGTITGTGEYMTDTVRWSIQKILNTVRDISNAIQGKINEVKTAILTVVDKIQDTLDYISQPYDSIKINTAFNNMAIKSDYNNMTTLVNNAVGVFDSTAEPNTFRIPVHLENIPILHLNTVQYIDLGWVYDSRSIIRAFMWCVTTFSLLYTIIDALPSYLQGNDE